MNADEFDWNERLTNRANGKDGDRIPYYSRALAFSLAFYTRLARLRTERGPFTTAVVARQERDGRGLRHAIASLTRDIRNAQRKRR